MKLKLLLLIFTSLCGSLNLMAEEVMYYKNADNVIFAITVTSEAEKTAMIALSNWDPDTQDYISYSYDHVTELTLPQQYNGYTITSIANDAFWSFLSLQKLTIPEGYLQIGDNSFSYLPKLTELSLPTSLGIIGFGCFSSCEALEEVTIPENATMKEGWGNAAFGSCPNLKQVTLNCKNVERFLSSAGFVITVEKLHFGKSFERLDDGHTYYENALRNLKYITVDQENPLWDSRNNCNALIGTADNTLVCGSSNTIIPNSVERIGLGAFNGRQLSDNIVIPEGIKEIGERAYANTSIKTFKTLGPCRLGEYVFEECTSLKSADFADHNSVSGAFYGCPSLESLTFGVGCNIGELYGAEHLKSIKIQDSPWHIDEENGLVQDDPYTITANFAGCPELTDITLGEGGYIACFSGMESLKTISIPKGCTIGDYCFENCTGLQNVVLPDEVGSMGKDAFRNCTSLETITIPKFCRYIGWNLIDGCINLKEIRSYIQEPYEALTCLHTKYEYSITSGMHFEYPATLLVPYGTKALYQQYSDWNKCGEIIEMEASAIGNVMTPNERPQTIYSLSGQQQPHPTKGVNIINGRKVLLK